MSRKNETRKIRDSRRFYRNLRVKVYGCGYNQLAGLPLLATLFDDLLLDKIMDKGYNTLLDKVELRFRRGIKVIIYPR